jgi:hypothetical protein
MADPHFWKKDNTLLQICKGKRVSEDYLPTAQKMLVTGRRDSETGDVKKSCRIVLQNKYMQGVIRTVA